MLTLVIGGARSGKSAIAERLAASAGDRVTYLATGPGDDASMAARIAEHRRRRPAVWETVECGAGLAVALSTTRGPVLVDSLGTWLAAHRDLDVELDPLLAALHRADPTVVVTDEVGLGVAPSTEIGNRFRDALGAVNRAVADQADRVLLVVAGRVLPLHDLDAVIDVD